MLQIRLLGQFDVRADGKRVSLTTPAGQSLLAWLVLNPNVDHRREKLAAMLWLDTPDFFRNMIPDYEERDIGGRD